MYLKKKHILKTNLLKKARAEHDFFVWFFIFLVFFERAGHDFSFFFVTEDCAKLVDYNLYEHV